MDECPLLTGLAIRDAVDERLVEILVLRFRDQLTFWSLTQCPNFALDWLEDRETTIKELVIDSGLDSPRQTLRQIMRACPQLCKLTIVDCNTLVVDALACCIEERLCEQLQSLTLHAHRGSAGALYLMQVLARYQPPRLKYLYLRNLTWCSGWPKHLPKVMISRTKPQKSMIKTS